MATIQDIANEVAISKAAVSHDATSLLSMMSPEYSDINGIFAETENSLNLLCRR